MDSDYMRSKLHPIRIDMIVSLKLDGLDLKQIKMKE
jgi:hypothetical protein